MGTCGQGTAGRGLVDLLGSPRGDADLKHCVRRRHGRMVAKPGVGKTNLGGTPPLGLRVAGMVDLCSCRWNPKIASTNGVESGFPLAPPQWETGRPGPGGGGNLPS